MRAGHASSPLTLPSLSRQCFFRGQLEQTLLQHLGQGPSVVPRAFVSRNTSGRQDSLSNRGDSNFGGLFLARSRSNLSRPELRPISDYDSARRDHRPVCFGGLLPRCWSLLPTGFIGRCRRGHYVVRLGTAKHLSASLPGVDCTLADNIYLSNRFGCTLADYTAYSDHRGRGHGGRDFSTSLRNIPPRKNCLASAGLCCRHGIRGDHLVLGTELHALLRCATRFGASLIDAPTGQDPSSLVHRRLGPPSGVVRLVIDHDQTQLGEHFRDRLRTSEQTLRLLETVVTVQITFPAFKDVLTVGHPDRRLNG
ncbi:hypothetical protein Taro_003706 [Colocasia esculenta]|uniref:Uncharacterized protein n=1 Tax=Colocasia esculenta TaxID=4460 RepID=A0A843TPL1_COLES|nr:hypothetical protein [Colocasia esculenta]